jgi:hypothetical protein
VWASHLPREYSEEERYIRVMTQNRFPPGWDEERVRRPDVTERLDVVYGTATGTPLDRVWLDAGLNVLRRVEWEE